MALTIECRISIPECGEGEEDVAVVKEESTPTRTDEVSISSTAARTIADRIVCSERQEYECLINDNTQIRFEDSPEHSNIESDNFADTDYDAQAPEDPSTDSDIESNIDSDSSCDMQANLSEEEVLIAEEITLRKVGGRRAYMLEQQALLSSRRAAHLAALGRLGFPLAGYTIV